MAGGMGSRYGGLKQVDSFGPNNESILFEVNNRFQLCYCKIDSTTNTSQLKFEIMNIDLDSENVAEQIKEVLYN